MFLISKLIKTRITMVIRAKRGELSMKDTFVEIYEKFSLKFKFLMEPL